MLYASILAGGSGTRLWPRSRRDYPKQFQSLVGRTTLLQQTRDRIAPLIPAERTCVVTQSPFRNLVLDQLPMLSSDSVLLEPSPRGTAAAIGLAAMYLLRRDPDAVMAVLAADHLIAQEDAFRNVLAEAQQLAEEDWLVTIGIQPTHPATGYGYIERGELLATANGCGSFHVARFVEKPDAPTAALLLSTGHHFWNSGMFVWRADRILTAIAEHMPRLADGLNTLASLNRSGQDALEWKRIWHDLPDETIDYGVIEHSHNVVVIPADIGWSDVGDWAAIYDALQHDEHGNAVSGVHLSSDTTGSLIVSERLVVTLGLDDLVIVDTPDVIFVCPRTRAQDVKHLSALLKEHGLSNYLSLPVRLPHVRPPSSDSDAPSSRTG